MTVTEVAPTAEQPVGRRTLLRTLSSLAVLVILAILMVRNREALRVGAHIVRQAEAEWLVVAALGTCLLWVAGAVTQLGALAVRPPLGRLLAVQIAASFANTLLPAGTGGMAVNVRFLRRNGMTREAALASQALNSSAGALTHMVLLAIALLTVPHVFADATSMALPANSVLGTWGVRFAAAGFTLLAAAATALILRWAPADSRAGAVRRRLVTLLTSLRGELGALRAVLRDPRRGVQLWAGSVSVPLIHALVLVAVLHALSFPLTTARVVLIYLAASAISALVPSPGGVGALDVTLSAALVAAGVPTATALATVLIYRLITVWGTLVPSACVLGILLRRRVI